MKTENTIPPTNLELIVSQNELEPAVAEPLRLAFMPLFAAAEQWKARVNGLSVTDVSQKREMKLARESRLALKEIRCSAERQRKKLKEESLRRGKAVDGIYNVLEYLITPLEEQLMAMEQFAERKEAARLDAQLEERQKAIMFFGYPALEASALRLMEEEGFQELLTNARLMAEARQREAVRIEAERVAKELAEAEERARLAVENARLRAEADVREAQLKAEREAAEQAARVVAEAAAAEKRAAMAKAKAERMEAEAKAREEAAAREAQFRLERLAVEVRAEVVAETHAALMRAERESVAEREAVANAERCRIAAIAAQEKTARELAERQLADHRQATASKLAPAVAKTASVTIYGASDDLIEIEGALREEFEGGDELAYLAFSDGTVLTIQYADDGCWRIHRVACGTAVYAKTEADGSDTGNYSDRVTLSGHTGDLRWCVRGSSLATTY